MKQFSVKAALAGTPTFYGSDKRPIKDFHIFPSVPEWLCAIEGQTMWRWKIVGDEVVQQTDEFLYHDDEVWWLNVYSRTVGIVGTPKLYPTEEAAKRAAIGYGPGIKTVKVLL